MFPTPHRYNTNRQQHPLFLHWTPFLGVLAATVCFAIDFVVRMEGYHSDTPWMAGLETIAFLALVVGGVALALRVRIEKAKRIAAEYKRSNSLQTEQLHVVDGGTGLSVNHSQQSGGKKNKRTPFIDGGTFHSLRWRKSPRH